MKKKTIKKLAQQIWDLEQDLQKGINVQSAQNKIEKIMSTLSFEEVLELDDYITMNFLKS